MVGTTLQRGDSNFTDQKKVTLRSTSFLSDWLFDGQAKPVVVWLEDSAQDISLQKSIKAMQLPLKNWPSPLPHACNRSLSFREQALPKSPKEWNRFQREPSPSRLEVTPPSPNSNRPLSINKWLLFPKEAKVLSPLPESPFHSTSSRVAHTSDYQSPVALPPAQYPQVGGGLHRYHHMWTAWDASLWIFSIFQEGYRLEFERP